MSATVFGIWHVLPTLDGSDADAGRRTTAVSVVQAVAATAGAGLVLGWLRRRSGSVLAPVIVHTAINVSGFVAARLVGRRAAARIGQ